MADVYWTGSAVPVPEKQTLTIGGTWLASETLTVTLNGRSLVLTTGTTVSVTQVALDLVAMINGDSANQDETRSQLGSLVGEWAALTATSSAGVVTVTGRSDGHPIGTISVTETSTSGTILQASSVTANGPGNVNTVSNWSSGAVPEAGDNIIFDHRAAAGCKYGLDTLTAIALGSTTITKGFRYQIGLPDVNAYTASLPYTEPQEKYFQVGGGDVLVDGSNAQLIKISSAATNVSYVVTGTGSTEEANSPPLLIKVNHASPTVSVRAGTVGINYEPKTAGQLATLFVSGGDVEVGNATTLATVTMNGGRVVINGAVTTYTVGGGTLEHREGNVTTLTVNGGTCYVMCNDTLSTVNIGTGGVVDCTKDLRGRTFSAVNLYERGTLKDPLSTITYSAGINIYCKVSDVTLDIIPRKKYTLGAIS